MKLVIKLGILLILINLAKTNDFILLPAKTNTNDIVLILKSKGNLLVRNFNGYDWYIKQLEIDNKEFMIGITTNVLSSPSHFKLDSLTFDIFFIFLQRAKLTDSSVSKINF
jgi:hypothetical protein